MTKQDHQLRRHVGHEELFTSARRRKAWRAPLALHSPMPCVAGGPLRPSGIFCSTDPAPLLQVRAWGDFPNSSILRDPLTVGVNPKALVPCEVQRDRCPEQAPGPWNDDWPTQLQVHGAFNSFTSGFTGERTACPISCEKSARDRNIYKEFVSIYPNPNIQKSWLTIPCQIMGLN